MNPIPFANLPALGAPLEGGSFQGLSTLPDGTHCAVVLLPDRGDTRLTWKQAGAWAKKLKAELPSRTVLALLYANAKALIDADWYWSCEELNASYAWNCYFYYGSQYRSHKRFEGRAVAVRCFPVTA